MARKTLDSAARISILLEEYRALYTLAEFRMSSLDKRVPIGSAALVTFLGGVSLLDTPAMLSLMAALPLVLYWYLFTTIGHARSFEDVLRRIEAIERKINALAGATLLSFQSTHPSRGLHVGGRTGAFAVRSVATVCAATILTGSALVWIAAPADWAPFLLLLTGGCLTGVLFPLLPHKPRITHDVLDRVRPPHRKARSERMNDAGKGRRSPIRPDSAVS